MYFQVIDLLDEADCQSGTVGFIVSAVFRRFLFICSKIAIKNQTVSLPKSAKEVVSLP